MFPLRTPVLATGNPGAEGELYLTGLQALLSTFLLGPGYVGSLWLLLWMPLP